MAYIQYDPEKDYNPANEGRQRHEFNKKQRLINMERAAAYDKLKSPLTPFKGRLEKLQDESRYGASPSAVPGDTMQVMSGAPSSMSAPAPASNYDQYVAQNPVKDAVDTMAPRKRFDFNDRGPVGNAARDRVEQNGADVARPLSTGENIPFINPAIKERAVALQALQGQAPTDVTSSLGSTKRVFDTATTNRLQAVPGAYETALSRRVEQAPMVGRNETTGESFTAQPAPRMDRMELEKMIAAKALEEKQRQYDTRVQGARDFEMQKARIPGENAVSLQAEQNKGSMDVATLKAEIEREKIKADSANSDAERSVHLLKAKQLEQQIEQAGTTFKDQQERQPTPEQARVAAAMRVIEANPSLMQSEQGRAAYERLLAMSELGNVLGPDGVSAAASSVGRTPMQEAKTALENPEVASMLTPALEAAKALSAQITERKNRPWYTGSTFIHTSDRELKNIMDPIKRAYEVAVLNSPNADPVALKQQFIQLVQSQIPGDSNVANTIRDMFDE